MKFSTKLSPGRHSGYKIHHKIDPVDHAWREGATPKKYLNHAFFALPRSVVGARSKKSSIIRSCTLAEHGWREANKYLNYSFLRSRKAGLARGQKKNQLFVLALPRSAVGARPTHTSITRFCAPAKRARRKANKYLNYSFWRSREAWLA